MNQQRSFEGACSVHNGFLMNQESMTRDAESINLSPLRAPSFSGFLLLENERLVLEQPEGTRDNTGDHRVVVDDNQLFALVKLFEVGKGP